MQSKNIQILILNRFIVIILVFNLDHADKFVRIKLNPNFFRAKKSKEEKNSLFMHVWKIYISIRFRCEGKIKESESLLSILFYFVCILTLMAWRFLVPWLMFSLACRTELFFTLFSISCLSSPKWNLPYSIFFLPKASNSIFNNECKKCPFSHEYLKRIFYYNIFHNECSKSRLRTICWTKLAVWNKNWRQLH